MRPIALAVTLALALPASGTAFAADLGGAPRRSVPPPYAETYPPPVYAAAPIWTGLYAGGTIGYGWSGSDASDLDADGAIGTIFAGYNWQRGGIVLGVEADIGTGNLSGTVATAAGSVTIDTNVVGSLRARAGYLVSPALLIYATGGLAWADLDVTVGGLSAGSDVHYGYQIGAGAEMKMSSNVSLRLEYLYTDLENALVGGPGPTAVVEPDYHTVRAGVAFKF